jgi:hypothetical protein
MQNAVTKSAHAVTKSAHSALQDQAVGQRCVAFNLSDEPPTHLVEEVLHALRQVVLGVVRRG